MGMMYMHFYWGCDFIFLFNSWETQPGQCGKFGWYIVLAVVATACTDLIPYIKEQLINRRNNQISVDFDAGRSNLGFCIVLLILESIWILLSICVMLLIMSFNYGMVIAILVTKTVIYSATTIPKLLRGPSDASCIIKAEEFNGVCH